MRDQSDGHWGQDFLHGRDGVRLVPYARVDGAWTLQDETLVHWWQKMQRDRIVHRVFVDGEVTSLAQWIEHCQRALLIAFLSDTHWLGVAWLNNIKARTAMAHYAFFRESWGRYTRTMVNLGLDYWFAMPADDKGRRLDTIIGMTPTRNRLALRVLRDAHFHVLGSIPHLTEGGMTISYLTREAHGEERQQSHPANGGAAGISRSGEADKPPGRLRAATVQ